VEIDSVTKIVIISFWEVTLSLFNSASALNGVEAFTTLLKKAIVLTMKLS